MNNRPSPIKRLIVSATLACMLSQPAFADIVTISNVPLSSGTGGVLPNLMFLLDDTGTMDFDYLPEYVGGGVANVSAFPRMVASQECRPGDPCWYAGGPNGYNGVYYDPNINYKPGVKYDNTNYDLQNAFTAGALSLTSLRPDAYLGGTAVNLTTSTGGHNTKDYKYCNANGLCKRNGAVDSTGAVTASGAIDSDSMAPGAATFAMNAGQFSYRAHRTNASSDAFGLPEVLPMMVSWSRPAATATITTTEPHGLASGNFVYVTGTGNANIDGTSRPVLASGLTATQFQITVGNAGTTSGTTGSYRKHSTGTASRALFLVTVNSTAHGLQTNDIVSTANGNAALNVNNVSITRVNNDTFTFTSGVSGTVALGAITWVRTGLYTTETQLSSTPVTYRVTPVEYCSDPNLTTCQLATTPGTPPAPGLFPAYVRFCKTLQDAVAPGLITGNSTPPASPGTPRCVSKFFDTAPTGGSAYRYVRFGLFQRENIVNSGSYANRPARSDCTGAPNCTFTEEMQNYARWYTFYRTRLQTMKTAAGRAFSPLVSRPSASPSIPHKLRVGFITLNPCGDTSPPPSYPCSVQTTSRYLKVDNFSGDTPTGHAATWYSRLYKVGNTDTGSPPTVPTIPYTPMPEALSRVGWIFAGQMNTGLTTGIPGTDDPVTHSCQKNFALITTDGYWNAISGRKLDGTAMDNQDNVDNQTDSRYPGEFMVSRASGTFDGALDNNVPSCPTASTCGAPGSRGTLADVAMYYFKTDLRGPGGGPATSPNSLPTPNQDVGTDNVPTKPGNKNFAEHQHMVTFAIGMADGLMRYQPDYETATTGDFANIKNGANNACIWAPNAQCNWPQPQGNTSSAIDDVWHAAVNSRGTYYSARDTTAVAAGLEGALNALNVQVAAAAASSTSSPNITQTDRQIFSTTYETDTWSGRIVAQNIDATTGDVEPTILWQADTQFVTGDLTQPGKVNTASDTRTIKTFCNVAHASCTDKLKEFVWANLNPTEQAFFTNKCSPATNMSQCNSITGGAAQPNVNDGSKLVGYLRGWTGLELNSDLSVGSFRDRKFIDPATNATIQTVLGDTINAKPAFVRNPFLQYGDAVTQPYSTFKSLNSLRSPRLYVGANDGYLHAFNGDNGAEIWAYVPRFLLSNLWVLADSGYKTRHTYFADGSPETADIYDSTAGVWKTILVSGVNSGGRGYYALDVTDPSNPKGLWEFCADSAACAISNVNIGLTYNNPVIGKRSFDGRWVVVLTSGLNNAGGPGGDGRGYFYVLDALTGAVLNTVSTGTGNTATPSGLSKIAAFYDNAVADATFRYVYGGDQLGNVWRLDMSTNPATLTHVATLKDGNGKLQPITSKPVLTKIGGTRVLYFGTGRYLGSKDLSDPATQSPVDNQTAWQQSLYAFKDKDVDFGNNIRTGAALVTQTITPVSATQRTTTQNPVTWSSVSVDGWVMDFNPGGASPGERVNIDPELVLGTLIVTTNVPTSGNASSCSVGGDSWQYQLDFRTGSFLSTSTGQVAGKRTGQVITVGVAVVQLPSGVIRSIVTGADTSKQSITIAIGAGAGVVKRFSYRER